MSNIHSQRYQVFLRKLQQARKEAGLTQVQVAQKLRKPQSYISKCELGERRIDFVELEILAELYSKPLNFFKTA